MVKVIGNAGTGGNYNATHIDLPRDTVGIRPAHKPWCVDCKRKDRPLDDTQRCEQCASAVVTRAALKERWAEAERLERAQQREAENPPKKRRTRRSPKQPVRRPSKTTVLFDELGLPTIVVKRWALERGLITEIRKGRVSGDVAAAYLAARERGEVA